MKDNRTIIIFLLTILLLVACSPYQKLNIGTKVDTVKVSPFKDLGSINEKFHLSFENEEDIKIFIDVLNSSRPVSGDVDMPKGDYDLLLMFKDGASEGFHLWISKEYSTGTIMKTDDTATTYQLTKNSTNKLREILSY